ncbi:HK97 family phage prohead protease [Bradyrhizobium sp. McL0616]|uniref:HK97 family phage prohead protease n=1 Tax=Bradyrhizobium sp. McL0616 TaxID=3415674 RepID=UPI003CE8DE9A
MDRLEVKATLSVSDAGEITGTAWPFNAGPDSVGDLIAKGAFNIAVSDLPMLLAHNPDDLVGTWSEAKETDDGLVVKGRLHINESERARAVRGLVQGGLVSGLSIGFRTREAKQQGRNRVISALDLVEVSLVRNPAHPRARVTSAKAYDAAQAVAAIIRRFSAAASSN